MNIILSDFCLVLLIGISGSGKSTFAKHHFKRTEILSSDHFRALVSDDENDQSVSADAFNLLYHVAEKRLANKKLTVIDATNLNTEHRKKLLAIAKEANCKSFAIVLNLPKEICEHRNQQRKDRIIDQAVIDEQQFQLEKTLNHLKNEKFKQVTILNSIDEIKHVEIVSHKLDVNKEEEAGPFDIIGDVHGCYDELIALLKKLGYEIDGSLINTHHSAVLAPPQRKIIFLGDLADRGPKSVPVLSLVMNMVNHGIALCVIGNHDIKLLRYLQGKKVQLTYGLDKTVQELENVQPEFKLKLSLFLQSLVNHYVLDGGKLVVAHAGMKEAYQGRSSGKVKSFALYGETKGEIDALGLPIRIDWAKDYQGSALVVYGHTPVETSEWLNNTICLDTGCVFGGKLTALRYPEKELVSVPANKPYYSHRNT